MVYFQAQVAHREAVQRNTPELALPLTLLPDAPPQPASADFKAALGPASSDVKAAPGSEPCSMATCWDYSRCSITSGFPVFFYQVRVIQSV